MKSACVKNISLMKLFKMTFVKQLVGALLVIGLIGCGGRTEPAPAYRISGSLGGLLDGNTVKLLNNGSDALNLTGNGAFTFSAAVRGSYAVTVDVQPSWQQCSVSSGSGSANADVSNVSLQCVDVEPVVATLAGSATAGSTDASGTSASFDSPRGVALGADGTLYVADTANNKIRKVTTAGGVSTWVGSGAIGSADGSGTSATFYRPWSLAVDASGVVYVADELNHTIRKITADGVVSTLAGSGAKGGADASGSSASFDTPHGVAVAADGYVYVADTENHKIRKISPAGVVTTFAGSGSRGSTDGTGASASFSGPRGVTFDAEGVLYVADTINHKIRKITPDGVVTTLAGSGVAGYANASGVSASFEYPYSVGVDAQGHVYVADAYNHRIRKITPSGLVTTLSGSATSGSTDGQGPLASFDNPVGLAVSADGSVFVVEYNSHTIRKITPAP